jgi:hypothetical protein
LRIPAIAGGDKDTIPSAAAADPAVLDTKAVVG